MIICVPANILLWLTSGRVWPLPWMLGLSFSSLFLYAALTLFCLRLRWGMVILPVVWGVAGLLLLDKGGKIDLPDRCSILFLRLRQTRQ